jgi:hypothetical protein
MKPLMIIIPSPDTNPELCLIIEKESFKKEENGTITFEGKVNAEMFSVEGAVNFCTLVNNKIK